jgi:hypothetical protein
MSADLSFISPLISLIPNPIGLALNNCYVLAEGEGFIVFILVISQFSKQVGCRDSTKYFIIVIRKTLKMECKATEF